MRVGKPTPLQAEWLTKLGLPGLQNYDLPDGEVAEQLKMVRQQHGTPRLGHKVEPDDVLRARAEARIAYRHYGRQKIEQQVPHPYVLQLNKRLTWGIAIVIGLLIILLALAIMPGHAQQTKNNPGPPTRANVWFWNGTAYVPVEAAAPLPITCNNCSGSGLSVVDNTAFTASTSPFIPIGGWYSSAPTNCADGRQCTALLTTTRHLWTTCDNCSSSSFTDLAAFTPASTPVGLAACLFQTTPTNNPLTNLTAGAAQCTANRELYTAFRTTPTVNVGTFANTLGVTQSTSPWVVSLTSTTITGTVGVTQSTTPWTVAGGLTENNATPPATQLAAMPCRSDTNTRAVTVTFQVLLSCDANDLLRVSLKDTPSNTNNFNVNIAAAGATVGVTQSTSPWVSSCTAANCTAEIADGSANKFTSNSNTYTAKFGLDSNILGLDGALMSATNALFTQITDGAAAHGVMANFGVSPGGVKSLNVNASIFSGTTALGAPNTFGTTAPTGNALGTNASIFIGTTVADGNSGNKSAGSQRMVLATDQLALATWGQGATAAAVPSGAVYEAGNGSGNLKGFLNCDGYKFDRSSTADVQLVAISGATNISVCGYTVTGESSTASDVNLRWATNADCTTGATNLTPARTIQIGATPSGLPGIVVMAGAGFTGLNTGGSHNLCVHRSAAQVSEVEVWYTQF